MFGNLKPGADQQKVLETALEIGKRILPDGYKLVLSGSSESFRETRDSLVFALVLGLLVAYMVLASQFNSFLQPVTVLLSLPFSLTGALLGLWMGGMSLNLYSMIGLILLMGIVKKNSILLVDYSNQCVERGLPFREALLEACPTRLRPILMTSVATIAAALPQALSFGPGSESRSAMAVSVIGGVLLSTVLTLLVVPCFYLVTSRKPRKNLAPNL
jgi:HAE1 family hydrophobic/amphiphilic exporter-1